MVNNNRGKRVALDSIGCKLNQAETEALARQLARAGYRLVSPSHVADIYILNTCTVTHIADRKCRNWLRQAHAKNPDALVLATGCYARRAPGNLTSLEGVRLIQGDDQMASMLQISNETSIAPLRVDGGSSPLPRTRAFIKIQDGCTKCCSYCIVPLVRGGEKSLPSDKVVDEVSQRVAEGYKEVVLTGTEIGSYSYNESRLETLLKRILAETGIARLRLSSLQPGEITPGLVELSKDERLCRHFHIALQSGSDSVLKRMNRLYSTSDYQQAISLIRNSILAAAITTDVIVGSPAETETEFQESFDFCRKLGFARIHVFPYSPRPGTRAAAMTPQVSSKVKKQRSELMLALAKESARSFYQQFLGKTMRVLWEKGLNGTWSGLTDNYIRVYTRSDADLTNRLLPARLVEITGDKVLGFLD